jgi:hypothetical protein
MAIQSPVYWGLAIWACYLLLGVMISQGDLSLIFLKTSRASTRASILPTMGMPSQQLPVKATPGLEAPQTNLATSNEIQFWEGQYYGKRQLKLNPDGTGVMDYWPDTVAKFIIGVKYVQVELTWSRNQDQTTFTITGGSPENGVTNLIDYYGKTQTQKVLKVTAEEMHLLDKDGITEYVWTRTSPQELETAVEIQSSSNTTIVR